MKVMIELPGDKYYAVPREVLAKYSVPHDKFESELDAKWKNGNAVFQGDVEGQERPRTRTVALGVRG